MNRPLLRQPECQWFEIPALIICARPLICSRCSRHNHKLISNRRKTMDNEQLNELLYQALETELGGVEVYTTALRCAQNDELKEEWEKYLEQTQNHVQIVQNVLNELGLDVETETPG